MTSAVWRRPAAIVSGALLLTLLSTVVPRTRLEVQDWDCPPAPASCARAVQVRGAPFPFISDYHGISAVGSADLVSALLGEDHFHAGAFAADLMLFGTLLGAVAWARTVLASRVPTGAPGAPSPRRPSRSDSSW